MLMLLQHHIILLKIKENKAKIKFPNYFTKKKKFQAKV